MKPLILWAAFESLLLTLIYRLVLGMYGAPEAIAAAFALSVIFLIVLVLLASFTRVVGPAMPTIGVTLLTVAATALFLKPFSESGVVVIGFALLALFVIWVAKKLKMLEVSWWKIGLFLLTEAFSVVVGIGFSDERAFMGIAILVLWYYNMLRREREIASLSA